MIMLTLLFISISFHIVICCNRETGENRLYNDLIWTNNRNERPIYKKSDNVTVEFDFHLKLVSHFDESKQILVCSGFFLMSWKDEFLTWDPAHYNNTQFIRPPSSNVWMPDIVAANSFQQLNNLGGDFVSLKLYSTGAVEWTPGDLFSLPCDVDVKRYPFDTVECNLELIVWGYSESEVSLEPKQQMAGVDQFKTSGQWSLLSSTVRRKPFVDAEETLSRVVITLLLDRSSTNFIFSFILPVLILSLLGTFVFLIPNDSGEKISFAITIPLSYGVYMGFLADMVPQSSQELSVFLIFLGLTLGLSAVFVILSIFSVRVSNRSVETHPITQGYITFVTWVEAIKSCTRRTHVIDPSTFDDSASFQSTKAKAETMTWKRISRAFDLLFLWIFCGPLLLSILLVIIIVLN